MDLTEYMTKVKDNLANNSALAALAYNPDDKDMGYRSGLRYLGIQRTDSTDAIAQKMIYDMVRHAKRCQTHTQLLLFENWR